MSPVTPLSNQCIELEDSDVSADEEPGILPLTDNALREFENAMTRNDLDRLLGPTYAGIATNNDVSANAAGVAGKSDISKQQNQGPLRRINSLPTQQSRSTHKQPPVKKSPWGVPWMGWFRLSWEHILTCRRQTSRYSPVVRPFSVTRACAAP